MTEPIIGQNDDVTEGFEEFAQYPAQREDGPNEAAVVNVHVSRTDPVHSDLFHVHDLAALRIRAS